MGKLHTLRRAIERSPDRWEGARRAVFRDGEWHPSTWHLGANSYRAFIEHVLEETDEDEAAVGNAKTGQAESRR